MRPVPNEWLIESLHTSCVCLCMLMPEAVLSYAHTDQRNMGMSMKVERCTVNQIKDRFEYNKKKKEEEKKKYSMPDDMVTMLLSVAHYMDTEVDATHVDTTHFNATHVDTTHFDATIVDATHVDATHIDATNVDATDIDIIRL